jgi:hypothetical protein
VNREWSRGDVPGKIQPAVYIPAAVGCGTPQTVSKRAPNCIEQSSLTTVIVRVKHGIRTGNAHERIEAAA